MAIIESGGKSYKVHETGDEVRAALRQVLMGQGDPPYLELDLVEGGSILVSGAGSVIAVTDTPSPRRSVGFG